MRHIPVDFRQALRRHFLEGFFAECPYVHRAGYLSWIAAAKRPDTRRKKISQSIDQLHAQQAELLGNAKIAATP